MHCPAPVYGNQTMNFWIFLQPRQKFIVSVLGEFPAFGEVFVRERDIYLCHSLMVAALPQEHLQRGTKVVGVVGIGHASGIAANWGKVDQNEITQILTIPPASLSNRMFKFTLKYGTICLITFGLFRMVRPKSKFFL